MPFPLQTAAQLLHSLEQRRQRALLPTRIPAFDRLLSPAPKSSDASAGQSPEPRGGLARGSLIELAGARSSGRFAIALAALAAAMRAGEAAALVDLGDHFDPRCAETAGVDLRRVLWVRPRGLKEAAMSAEIALSAGFAVVVLDLGAQPVAVHRLQPSVWVRLARAAEAHNSVLLLISPAPIRTPAAGAVIATAGARGVWRGEGDQPRLLSGIAARLSVLRRKEAGETVGGLTLGVRDDVRWLEGA